MARFLDDPTFIEKCRSTNRSIDMKVAIDWFGDGTFEEIEYSDNEIIKLTLDRELEGETGKSITDEGTIVLDNSNDDYSPKSIASRFNYDLGSGMYEFNLIPNRLAIIFLSVNGSEDKLYYAGTITSIDSNHDNSRVSLTIVDALKQLESIQPPDKTYANENANVVIRDLVERTSIEYNPEKIDDLPFQITYNFRNEGSIFQSLRLIAEMVWGKFYVDNDYELNFIDFKNLNQEEMPIIEEIYDRDFLTSGYQESYSSDELYTTVEVDSSPLSFVGTEDDKKIIWTGAEKQVDVSEEYLGEDINSSDILQLTSVPEGSVIEEPTNNVPILEGTVSVSFENKVYIVEEGLSSVDYSTGEITFANNTEYPLPSPNDVLTIRYKYYILTLPPKKSDGTPYVKTIIAEYENPAVNVSNIEDYIKFEEVNSDSDSDTDLSSYSETIAEFSKDSSGTVSSENLEVSSDASSIRLSGRIVVRNADYLFWFIVGIGRKWVSCTTDIKVEVDGTVLYSEEFDFSTANEKQFDTGSLAVSNNSTVKLILEWDGSGEKRSYVRVDNIKATINEIVSDTTTSPSTVIEGVDVSQYNYPNNRKTEITFENHTDKEIAIYSTYKGENIDNIYLLGNPLKVLKEFHVEKTDDDANSAFNSAGKTLSVQNNLFNTEERIKKTVDFLLDYYSTPRTHLSVSIKGRAHLDLMDKVYVHREEADIDNEFIVGMISDEFTEDGEWNQTLELRQAKTSAWQYDSNGIISIVTNLEEEDDPTPRERPPSVTNLTLEIIPAETSEGAYPTIKVSYDGNRFTRIYTIYIKKDNETTWEELTRTTSEEYIINSVFQSGIYDIKVVTESYGGVKEIFEDAPVESINYTGTGIINIEDISLEEIIREIQKGIYASFMKVSISNYSNEYFNTLEVYVIHQSESNWRLVYKAKEVEFDVMMPELGDYKVKILPVDKHGNKPDFNLVDYKTITINGDTDNPSIVEWDEIYWGADYIKLTWMPNSDDDFEEYEIRLNDSDFGDDN